MCHSNKLLVLLGILLLIPGAAAFEISVFSDGSAAINASFYVGNQADKFAYIKAPKNINVSVVELNVTGYRSFLFQYDLSPDQTACFGSWDATQTCAKTYDGDYGTYGQSSINSQSWVYLNFTIPAHANSTLSLAEDKWPVDSLLHNNSIPSGCWAYWDNKIMLRFVSNNIAGGNYMNLQCRSSTGWNDLHGNKAPRHIYDEAVWWAISNASAYPFNVSISIGQVPDYFEEREVNTSRAFNITLNTSLINDFLLTCTADALGACNIPLNLSVLEVGTLELNSLNISYDYYKISEEGYHSTVYETDQPLFWFDIDVLNWTAIDNVSASFMWNGSEANITPGLGNNYSVIINVPEIDTEHNVTAYWNYTICYGSGSCTEYNYTLHNISVNFINITECTSGNIALTFRGYNESNPTQLMNYDLGIDLTAGFASKPFNFSFTGSNTYHLCISPGDETYSIDADLEYSAQNHATRHYYLRNLNISNTTRIINLYLLHSSLASEITFNIRDSNYRDLSAVIIKAQRHYPDLGKYLTVDMGKTDNDGKVGMYLRFGRYYKWLLERENAVLLLTEPSILFSTTINLFADAGRRDAYFQYFDQVAFGCNMDRAAKYIICEYSDTSGKMVYMELTTRQVLLYNRTAVFCTDTSTAAADTLTCSYAGYENDTIIYVLRGRFTGSLAETLTLIAEHARHQLKSEVQESIWGESLGVNGVILALLIILVITTAWLHTPKTAIIGSMVGVGIASLFTFTVIGGTVFVGLVIAAGFLIYVMRDR